MAYEQYCAACTYLSESADYSGRYWCSTKGEDHYACDPKCYSFCEAYGRRNSARENMYDNSASHSGNGGGCYLTTIMCNILGYDDNNYYLQTLRNFRDQKMKTNVNYLPLLYTYDIIGPKIANSLNNDPNKQEIAKAFFERYIIKSVEAIEEEKEQTAINIYVAMTDTLARFYNINTNIITPDLSKIDANSLGHGRIPTKKLKKNYSTR